LESTTLSQTDLYLALYLAFAIILGMVRGLSGEVGASLKFILATIISYSLIIFINEKFNLLSGNMYSLLILSVIIYFVTGFLLKIIIAPFTLVLKTIIPNFIDKPLGIFLGLAKSLIIITFLYIMLLTSSNLLARETPKWLVAAKANNYLHNFTLQIFQLIPNLEYDANNIGDNSLLTSLMSTNLSQNKLLDLEKLRKMSPDDLKKLQNIYQEQLKQSLPTVKAIEEKQEVDKLYNLDDLIDNIEKTN
jgi:uncharacterized membrane protein required for colicin V production